MVGELNNLRLATEGHYLFKDEKFILMFKRVPSGRTKADGDIQPTFQRSAHYWQYSC